MKALFLTMALMASGDTLQAEHIDPSSLFEMINNYRHKHGRRRITYRPDQQASADKWSEHIVSRLGHARGLFWENIAVNWSQEEVMQAWIDSPGHKKNLLQRKARSGVVSIYAGKYKGRDALFCVFRAYD